MMIAVSSDPAPQDAHPAPKTGATVFVVILSSFMMPFMMASLNVALPSIGAEFAMSAVTLSWVVTSYSLATAVVLLPSGRIGDLYGRNRVFVWGLVVFTLGAALSAAATGGAALLAARVVNGVGAGMNFGTGMAILMTAVLPRDRGRVLGWNVAAVYLGLSLGPVIGGIIAHDFGWRWIFVLSAAAGLPAAAVSAATLRHDPPAARDGRFDVVGSCLYGMALVGVIVGCTLTPKSSAFVLMISSGVCFAAFVSWERRNAMPIFDVDLFTSNRLFAFSNLAALIHYASTAAVGFLLSLYLQYVKGLSAQQAGLVMMTQPIVMTVFSPVAGRLSDRVTPGSLASAGMMLAAVSLGLFCFLGRDTPLGFVIVGLVVLGFGFALFSSPNTHAVMGAVPPPYYGAASGVLGTMRVVGQVVSMAVVMLIATLVIGSVRIGAENAHAFLRCQHLSFAIFAGLCLAGVFASLVRGRKGDVTS